MKFIIESKKTEAVLPFIMLIAGFLIIYLPYKYESNIAKEKLKELLE